MNSKKRLGCNLSRISLCILSALYSQQLLAQAAPSEESEVERISIIGSNIKRATDIGALPVSTLTEKRY